MNNNHMPVEPESAAAQHFLRLKQTKADADLRVSHPDKPLDFKDVARLFPNVPLNTAFKSQAENTLKSAAVFVSMAVQIDQPPFDTDSRGNGPSAETIQAVADAIQKLCDANQGIWGIIDARIFGCCFADCNLEEGQQIAEQLRRQLAAAGIPSTLTIGVAGYPTLKYPKNQIIDNALKAIEHAQYLGPDATVAFDAVTLNISGDGHYEAGDIDGAIQEFKNALLLDAANENVHNSLGVCYGELGDYKNALAEFEVTLQLKPSETFAMYNAGLAHKLLGNHQKALSYFLKSLEQDAELFEAAFQTGRLYHELNLPEKGIDYLQKAIRLNPESSHALAYLGECYAAMEMNKEAVSTFKTAIKKNAGDTVALSGLGWLYHRLGQNAEIALLFCRQSVEIDPDNGLHRFRLGRLLAKDGLFHEALAEYKAAAQLGYDAAAAIEDTNRQLELKDSEHSHPKSKAHGIKN